MTRHQTVLTVHELQKLVEQLSVEYFQKPFLHEVVYNARLRTTGGRYMLKDHSIQVNPIVELTYGREELIGVLKHELCHYHLHIAGKGYRHGDSEFKSLLAKTKSPRFCKPLVNKSVQQKSIRVYVCSECGIRYERQRRVDIEKYRCGKCHGKLVEN